MKCLFQSRKTEAECIMRGQGGRPEYVEILVYLIEIVYFLCGKKS